MIVIGKANKYFTMWTMRTEINNEGQEVQVYTYMQNLSMDLDQAKMKVAKSGREFQVDLTVHGSSSFSRIAGDKKEDEIIPADAFQFGRYKGQKFANTMQLGDVIDLLDDIDFNKKRIAKTNDQELIEYIKETLRKKESELELLQYYTKHNCFNDNYRYNNFSYFLWYWAESDCEVLTDIFSRAGIIVERNGKFVTLDQATLIDKAEKKASLISEHYFNNGDKVDVMIKEIESFSFMGNYGRCHVVTYESNDGKMFKYMGSSPADIPTDEFVEVIANIKHCEYRGEKETRLQRIKVQK